MSLLLLPADLASRREAARGPLAPLAESLARDLEPVLASDVAVPRMKARLTREGGRCATDGTTLFFDPFARGAHACPRCGAQYEGRVHEEWWTTFRQLWLAERAVHAALLHLLAGDPQHAALADRILRGMADAYLAYPNRDNVLGPSRPFFSTYLESIWMLQLCVAVDLLGTAGDAGDAGAIVRDRVIEPSRMLIASYPEGLSNRQSWNIAALAAAASLLDDRRGVEDAIHGRWGLTTHLQAGLLDDGSWYEGENYHLFAHRALWYARMIARNAGTPVQDALNDRHREGYATPFLAALPDLTLPSRRDSQYAISLRQWRFAELAELGLAETNDDRLSQALRTLYDGSGDRLDTGRSRSTAEVERNTPPVALTRADLGWRSLLLARPELTLSDRRSPPRSVLLGGQGLAIIRRDGGNVWTALDYGHSGGGHGHPDRLSLTLAQGSNRWLDDPGTGSYVDRSLHWYRSTLAHNAPLVDGRSQERVHGTLLAFEDRGAAGWMDAEVQGTAPGTSFRRTLVVMPDYLLDVLSWSASHPVSVDLPLHLDADVSNATWEAGPLTGGDGLEDGFGFLSNCAGLQGAPAAISFTASAGRSAVPSALGEGLLHGWIFSSAPVEWWRATAPGPPGHAPSRFILARARGESGVITTLLSWADSIATAEVKGDSVSVTLRDGSTHVHARTDSGWHIDLRRARSRSSVDLGGVRAGLPCEGGDRTAGAANNRVAASAFAVSPFDSITPQSPAGDHLRIPLSDEAGVEHSLVVLLGESHYRRSELVWAEAGSPTAEIRFSTDGASLHLTVEINEPAPRFAPADAINPLDNEHADVNSDSVQLYYVPVHDPARPGTVTEGRDSSTEQMFAWHLVPKVGSDEVRMRRIAGSATSPLVPKATWRQSSNGYLIDCSIPLAVPPDTFVSAGFIDVIVNRTAPDRERRLGQLVLSGGGGEWIYLRGDRHSPESLIPFSIGTARSDNRPDHT